MQKFKAERGFRYSESLPERAFVVRGRALECWPLDIARAWLLMVQLDPGRFEKWRKTKARDALSRARGCRLKRERLGLLLP
jgi:hypothetical protein